jgi:hypothetical protein
MPRSYRTLAVTLFLLVLGLPSARAQDSTATQPGDTSSTQSEVEVKEARPGLKMRARVPPVIAVTVARSTLPPGATLVKGVLEDEGHSLVYSLEFTVTGKKGIQFIRLDARSGVIVTDHDHDENAADHVHY